MAGNEITPFVLKAVNQITQGQSLKANLALIKHNADVGSRIARKLGESQVRKVQTVKI